MSDLLNIPLGTAVHTADEITALLVSYASASQMAQAASSILALQSFQSSATATLGSLQTSVTGHSAAIATLQANVGSSPLGTAATHAAADFILTTDTRLTNARTPSAHAASHAVGGTDALSAASTSASGIVKKAAALSTGAPTLSAPSLLTGAVSLATVQTLQTRFEQLVSNLQAAGTLS